MDEAVLLFLNRAARASWTFDTTVAYVSVSHLLKGGAAAALLSWLWFRREDEAARGTIVVTLVASLAALVVGRVLALTLPYRARPLHEERLELVLPYGVPETRLEAWSSLPSDHAVLFVALLTGIAFVSRRAALAATVWVAIVILLPRLYLGLHYPSDLAAGAVVGAAVVAAALRSPVRDAIAGPASRWRRASPGTFYAVLFLLFFQLAVMFEDGRGIARLVQQLLSPHL